MLFRERLFLLILLLSWVVVAEAKPPKASHYAPVISIGWQDLHHGNAPVPVAFDISPDGSRLAVEFLEVQPHAPKSSVDVWIAVWDISTKQQLNAARIDGPIFRPEWADYIQLRYDVRFSPDSHLIVVQNGLRLRVITADTLAPIYSVDPLDDLPPSNSGYGPVIENFSASADGRRIAVLSGYLKNSPVSVITVLDLRSGQRLHTWRTADIAHVTLSPDGSLLVLNEGAPDNRPGSLNEISRVITVRSAADLKVLRTWDKDLTAPVFTSTTQFAAIAPIWLDRCKPVLAGLHILPVDDASNRTWTFAPLGPSSANLAVAPEKHIVAAILLHIRTGFLARFHEDCGLTGNEIRFFNLDTDTSTVVLRDIDVVSGGNPFSSNSDILRISADATWIGLFQGGQITVRKFHHAAR